MTLDSDSDIVADTGSEIAAGSNSDIVADTDANIDKNATAEAGHPNHSWHRIPQRWTDNGSDIVADSDSNTATDTGSDKIATAEVGQGNQGRPAGRGWWPSEGLVWCLQSAGRPSRDRGELFAQP